MRSLPSWDCFGCLSRAISFLAARFSLLVFLAGLLPGLAWAQTNVVTQHYDASRSGLNPNEVILTPSNVNSSQFGKLFSQSVDGQVYAQPLYVQNVTIPGMGTHNVVFVETQNDSVYAFDADSNTGANANPLWQVSVIDTAHGAASGATAVPSTAVVCNNVTPVYGIDGTPTIDVSSGTMYVEAESMENGSVLHRLHALNITTGAEKSPGPILVNPSVAGTGNGSVNGKITLDPVTTWNRTGLLLMNGTVYISFGSHCDVDPWHGWLVAYNASTFALKAVYNATPNGGGGGIWMAAGAGLAADSSGNIYIATGNGSYDGVTEFSDSVVKLGPFNNGTLPVADWFTPFDQSVLDSKDEDLASGGVLLLPDQPPGSPRQHLLVAGGKDGTLFVLDRDNLGRFNPNNNSQVWQSFPNSGPGFRAAPAWWNNTLFVSQSSDTSVKDNLRAYKFDPQTSTLSGVSTSNSPELFGFPDTTPIVTANGTTNAIVWLLQNNGYATGAPTILRAYDATNLANELYNSTQNSARDNPGPAVKYTVPMEINGKVYVGTQTQLSIFGELFSLSSVSVNPASVVGGSHSTGTITLSAPAPSGGAVVTLQSSNTAVATVPGTVTVAANATTATFTVSTSSVTTISTSSISATYNGSTQSTTLTVVAPLTVTTTSLPNGTQNSAYSTTLTATGGTTPYTWSLSVGTLPAGLTIASSTGVISGTPTGTGTTNFTVQVTDANSLTATKPLSLTVVASPTVTTTSLPNGTQNAAYSTTLTATGGTTPYTWSLSVGTLPAGLTIASSTGVISGTPTGTGTTNFTVQVTDANSLTATKPLSLTVVAPPTVTTTSLHNGTQNVAYSTTLTATGGTTPYAWSLSAGTLPAGLTIASSTGVISGTPTVTGTTNFTVQVTDANSLTATKPLSLTVVAPPSVTTTSLPNGTQNAAYSTTLTATGGTTPYTWSLSVGTLPAGLTIASSTGVISGTPTVTGTTNFTVQVTDANSLTAAKPLSITISISSGGGIALVQANAVQGSSVRSVSAAFPVSNTAGNLILAFVSMSSTTQTVTLTDSAGNTFVQAVAQVQNADTTQVHLFYAKNILGASANTVTATFSTTNNHPWLAIYEFSGLSTTNPLDQTASAQGSSKTPSSGATPTTTSANELVFGATGLAPTYSGSQTAGSGFTMLENDTGSSPAANEFMLVTSTGSYTAGFALSGTPQWSAIVATFASGTPVAPVVTTTSLPNGTQNAAYSATLTATGGTTPYTWSVSSGTLPAGLTIDSSAGVISGTPTVTGTTNFTVQVTDANSLTATKPLSLTVVAPPSVTTTSLPNGTQNVAYSTTLTATGGTTPYTWSLSAGTLPAGLTIASSTGVISGTPTVTGTTNFTVQVTDANSQTAAKPLSLTVVAPPLTVTTTSLPNGTQNVAYSTTLTATGGTTPYTWSLSVGTLPAGLTIASSTGVISGTPTVTGTTNFTVQVTDANSLTAAKPLSITISISSGGGIALVQANAVQGSSVRSVSAAFPVSNTAGNLILAFVSMSSTTQTVTLTDSAGNTFVQAVAQVQNADTTQVHLFYAKNILGASANTVTATFSTTNNHPWLAIYEFSGLSTTNPLDQTASAQGSSKTPSSGATPTTTSANELVFGATGLAPTYSGSQTAGSGFTMLENDTGSSPAANEFMLVTSTGSYTAGFALSGTPQWSAIVATFASGTPVAPVVTTTSLPNGTQNAAYSATLTATGGTTPYTWSVSSGTLPAGLTIDSSAGVISGTPTGTGTTNFTVQVTDVNSLTATKSLSITINTSSGGGIGLVQENAVEGSAVGSMSVAFPTANTAGNLILAFVRMSSTTQTVTVSDSAGNAYIEAVAQVQTAGTSQVHLFYAKNSLGAANTVKATFSSTNSHPWLAIYEFKGLSTTNPLDQTAHAQGNNAAPNSGATPTTTSANELVFGAMEVPATYPGTQTVGSGYTLLQEDTATSHASNESMLVTSTGSYTATFTLSSGTDWATIIATFKP